MRMSNCECSPVDGSSMSTFPFPDSGDSAEKKLERM